MYPQWQPGEQYNYGDIVVFQGCEYKIIQPHRSQGDWTPPVTPALWGRLQACEEQCGGDYKAPQATSNYQQQCGGDYKAPQAASNYQQQFQASDDASYEAPQEQKSWIEGHKKELEIGGGLLAGATALAGGLFAYKHHQEKNEEKRAQAWSESNWMAESQARTQKWRAGQHNGPVAWIWNEGQHIPRDAIQGGEERGEALYICRAYRDGGIFVGKACRVFKKGGVIGYKKDEVHVDKYEILVGNSRAVRWVSCSGQINLASLGARPVEGGREPDGSPIYIAQAPYHGAVHPGKASELYGDGCFIPYDDTEKKVKEYAVLCYA